MWRPENNPEVVAAILAAKAAAEAASAQAVAAQAVAAQAVAAPPFVVVNSADEARAARLAGQTAPFFSREIAIELGESVTAVLSTTGLAGNPAREVLCALCHCAMRNHSYNGAVPKKQFHKVNSSYVPNGTSVYEAPRPAAKKDEFCRAKRSQEPGPVIPWTKQSLWRFV